MLKTHQDLSLKQVLFFLTSQKTRSFSALECGITIINFVPLVNLKNLGHTMQSFKVLRQCHKRSRRISLTGLIIFIPDKGIPISSGSWNLWYFSISSSYSSRLSWSRNFGNIWEFTLPLQKFSDQEIYIETLWFVIVVIPDPDSGTQEQWGSSCVQDQTH